MWWVLPRIAVIVLLISFSPLLRADVDPWVGKYVLPKGEAAKRLWVSPDSKETFVATLLTPVVLVEQEKGGWIRVRSSHGEGWLPKENFVSADEAVTFFTERIRTDDSDSLAYYGRAMAYQHFGDSESALRDLDELVRRAPKRADFLLTRGTLWCDKGNLDHALRDYSQAIQIDPSFEPAYVCRAQVWLRKGLTIDALSDYNSAIRLSPQSSDNYALRGDVFHLRRELDKAVADYDEAVRLSPRNPSHLLGRAVLKGAKNDIDGALTDVNGALLLDEKYVKGYDFRALLWQLKHEFGKASADYDAALRVESRSLMVLSHAAIFLSGCPDSKYRDGKRAVELARKAAELREWKDPAGFEILAMAYAEAGDFEQAVYWQKKALADQNHLRRAGEVVRVRLRLYEQGRAYHLSQDEDSSR